MFASAAYSGGVEGRGHCWLLMEVIFVSAMSAAVQNVTRELQTRAGALVDEMVDAVAFAGDESDERGGEVIGVGWVGDLVADDPQRLAGPRSAENCLDEVAAPMREKPGRAHDDSAAGCAR